jgi:hypothetical protein
MMHAALVLASIVVVIGPPPGDRLSDRDVKALLERIDQERDRFEDQLDGEIKRKIIRDAGTEVSVERFLDDLQNNIDTIKDRFKPDYAASREVGLVLSQGSHVERFMASQPPNLRGASEWNQLAASLGQLASVYGAALPFSENQPVRRINDGELRQSAQTLANAAGQLKKALDATLRKDTTVDKATREAAVAEVEALQRDARTLADRVDAGKPASGEARQLLDRAARVRTAIARRALSTAGQKEMTAVGDGLEKIAQAFGLPGVPPS